MGLAVDKDVAGAGHVAALGQVDDQEEAGAREGVVELVEVLAVPALDHLPRELQNNVQAALAAIAQHDKNQPKLLKYSLQIIHG